MVGTAVVAVGEGLPLVAEKLGKSVPVDGWVGKAVGTLGTTTKDGVGVGGAVGTFGDDGVVVVVLLLGAEVGIWVVLLLEPCGVGIVVVGRLFVGGTVEELVGTVVEVAAVWEGAAVGDGCNKACCSDGRSDGTLVLATGDVVGTNDGDDTGALVVGLLVVGMAVIGAVVGLRLGTAVVGAVIVGTVVGVIVGAVVEGATDAVGTADGCTEGARVGSGTTWTPDTKA